MSDKVCTHKHIAEETVTDYWPSQEEIDLGTDQDRLYTYYYCIDCGEDLDYYDAEVAYYAANN